MKEERADDMMQVTNEHDVNGEWNLKITYVK